MTATDLVRRTYAWTGTPNASPSVQRDNGATVRTNRVPNPTFATDTAGWSGSWDSVNRRLVGSLSAAMGEGGAAVQSFVAASAGERRRYGARFYNTSAVALAVSLQVVPRNGSTTLAYLEGESVTVQPGTDVWLTNTPTAAFQTSTTGILLNIRVGPGGWPAGSSFALDTVIDTEVGDGSALRATDYFDGGTGPVAAFGDYVVPLTTMLATATGSTVPLLMLEHETVRTTQHTVHEILGRSDPDVTFGPTQTRSGSMTLLYETLAAATTARDLFAAPGAITLTQTDLPQLSMQFVVPPGDLAIAPDQEDADLWTLTLPFREVIA